MVSIPAIPQLPGRYVARSPIAGYGRTAPFTPQDIGGSGSFQGQDIMGGAAIIFKRPERMRDLVGGAAMLVVKRQTRPSSTRPGDIARNTTPDRRRPNTNTRPGTTEVANVVVSESDKAEAFKNQGNTYYDLGQFAQAVEAYQNAAKKTPKNTVIYNNLGAANFSLNNKRQAADTFKKYLALETDHVDSYVNLGDA